MVELLARYEELQGEECKEENLKRVRQILNRRDSPGGSIEIAFRMGDIYRGAVEACLDSTFGTSSSPQLLLECFRQRVVHELDRCVV